MCWAGLGCGADLFASLAGFLDEVVRGSVLRYGVLGSRYLTLGYTRSFMTV